MVKTKNLFNRLIGIMTVIAVCLSFACIYPDSFKASAAVVYPVRLNMYTGSYNHTKLAGELQVVDPDTDEPLETVTPGQIVKVIMKVNDGYNLSLLDIDCMNQGHWAVLWAGPGCPIVKRGLEDGYFLWKVPTIPDSVVQCFDVALHFDGPDDPIIPNYDGEGVVTFEIEGEGSVKAYHYRDEVNNLKPVNAGSEVQFYATPAEGWKLWAHLKTPSKQEHKRHGTKKAIFIPKRSKYRLK